MHATAESEAEQFKRLGLNQWCCVIPNGVDLPEGIISDQMLPCTGIQTILFLSRIHPKKGLLLWVAAWAKVRPRGWRMRVIGPDENGHRAEVMAAVRDAGLEKIWSFEDPVTGVKKEAALRGSDLAVLPTYSENFGIFVAEALAAGTPVITTQGTPWEGLLEKRCGWWVSPDVDSLAEALNCGIEASAGDRAGMGRRGAEWMRQDFGWDSIGKRMKRFYEQVIEQEI